jgi:hypothetical protein
MLACWLMKCPLSIVPRCPYSVSCKGRPTQYPNYGLRRCHSSRPSFVLRTLNARTRAHFTILSKLSTRIVDTRSCYTARESSLCRLLRKPAALQWMHDCHSARACVTYPRSLSAVGGPQDSVVTASHRGLTWNFCHKVLKRYARDRCVTSSRTLHAC